MTSFRFDIGNMNSRCEKVRTNISKYKNICEQTYISAKSITNSWNDPASEAFFSKVQNDELKISEIYNALEDYQKNIEYFGNELSTIFSNKGYSTNGLVVNYDTYHIDGAKGELNTVKNHIRTAQKAFEDCVIPCGFDNLPILNEIFNALYNDIGALAGAIEGKLNDTRNQIDGLISTTQAKNNSIQFVTIEDRLTQVAANTVYMDNTYKSLDKDTSKIAIKSNIDDLEYKNADDLETADKAVISSFNGNSDVDVTIEEKDAVFVSGNTDGVESVTLNKLDDETVQNSNINITDTKVEENKLEEEEEVEINPTINETTADISINNENDEIKINTDVIKTNIDSVNIAKSDDSSVSFESVNINNGVDAINLEKGSSTDIGNINANVNTDSSINLEKGSSVDIDSIISEVKSNSNLNLESGRTVTAEEIINHE